MLPSLERCVTLPHSRLPHALLLRPACRVGAAKSLSSAARMVTASSTASSAAVAATPSPEVLQIWRSAEAVCFDVDSTFCVDESIDEIAAFLGVGEQVAALTTKAMGGSVKFEQALADRLGLMKPSKADVQRFLKEHPPRLSPGIPELVQQLQQRGVGVFLVSGGFRAVIHPIAQSLGIPLDHVYANTILFDEFSGDYAGFDAQEFTSRSGGKAAAIREIKATHGYQRIAMVGDGATDLEARQPGGADIFVGYGGVVIRPNIAAQADWYVYDIRDLLEPTGKDGA